MRIAGWIFAAVAAAIHVYIFVLESVRWTAPATRAVFGTTEQQAEDTRLLAYNQGFYNLFLAVMAVLGIIFGAAGATAVGAALIFAGCGAMTLAGLVLITSGPGRVRPALVQLVAPALAVIATAIAVS